MKGYFGDITLYRVINVAKGASLMTDTKMNYQLRAVYADLIPNNVLVKIMDEAVYEIGIAEYSEEEYAVARRFWNLNSEDEKLRIKEDYRNEYGSSFGSDIDDKPINRYLKHCAFEKNYQTASTDVGNVGYIVPTILLSQVIASIDTPVHTWRNTAQAATGLAHKGLLNAGKIMALTCLRLFKERNLLDAAAEELNKGILAEKEKLDEVLANLELDEESLL